MEVVGNERGRESKREGERDAFAVQFSWQGISLVTFVPSSCRESSQPYCVTLTHISGSYMLFWL
jgi:hypothetical protein